MKNSADLQGYNTLWDLQNSLYPTKAKFNNIANYYMALSHKDWEQPNSRIWLAEMDIDRGLDFPI